MFSSFLAKKKNETIPLQWLKTKKFYSGLGHLEENEPAKLLHLFTLNSSLQSASARPGVVSPPPNRDNVPVFHGESAPCFGGIYSLFGGNLFLVLGGISSMIWRNVFHVPWGICSLFRGESVPCFGGICSVFQGESVPCSMGNLFHVSGQSVLCL